MYIKQTKSRIYYIKSGIESLIYQNISVFEKLNSNCSSNINLLYIDSKDKLYATHKLLSLI